MKNIYIILSFLITTISFGQKEKKTFTESSRFKISIGKSATGTHVKTADDIKNKEHEILAKFIITDATFNDKDFKPIILEQGAYTVFYNFKDDSLIYMSNYWPKDDTQSFGPMYSTKMSFEEKYDAYQADVYSFNWAYINSYDDKKGIAKVQLTKIYKPTGVSFILKIIPENNDVIIFKGYLEGSVDFSKY
jgi:hypothetical protein